MSYIEGLITYVVMDAGTEKVVVVAEAGQELTPYQQLMVDAMGAEARNGIPQGIRIHKDKVAARDFNAFLPTGFK